jgi:hypothetical protein
VGLEVQGSGYSVRHEGSTGYREYEMIKEVRGRKGREI